jgi:hypothetical protein
MVAEPTKLLRTNFTFHLRISEANLGMLNTAT